MQKYSFLKSLGKSIKYPALVFLGLFITFFIDSCPKYASMTIGSVLILIYDYLKHKIQIKLP